MYWVRWALAVGLLSYGAWMVWYFQAHPTPPKPLTDWKTFHERLHDRDNWDVAITVGVSGDEEEAGGIYVSG